MSEPNARTLRQAVEQSPLSIVITDKTGAITYINACFTELCGYPVAEVLGNNPRILQSGFTPRETYQELWATITAGGRWSGEFCNKKKNGELYWEEASITALKDELGDIVGYVGVKQDVTKRKLAEQLASATIEALSAHICVLDATGTIVAVNRAWRQFAEANPPVRANVLIGANYLRVCDSSRGPGAADALAFAAGVRAVLQGHQADFELEYSCHSPEVEHWFVGRVTRSDEFGRRCVVVAHTEVTKRKKAERALRESEERYRRLFETEEDAIFLFDYQTHRFLDANPAACKLYGYEREEFLRMKATDVSAEPEKSAESIALKEQRIPLRWHRKKNGTTFPVEIASAHYSDGDRDVHVGAARDISERIKAEQALREGEERYRRLFEVEKDAIFLVDLQTCRFLDANPAACKLYGFEREEFLQLRVTDISAEPHQTAEAIIAKEPLVELRWHRKKDGTRLPVEILGAYYQERDRDVHVATVRDVSQRITAEQALRESEEKYRNLFYNAQVGMYRSRLDDAHLLDCNDKCLDIFGYDRDDLRHSTAMVVWADAADRDVLVRRLMADGHVTDFECGMINKQGAARMCLVSARAYPDQGVIEGSIIDITERKEAAERISMLSRRLIEVQEEERKKLARELHDELGQVLTAVRLNLKEIERLDVASRTRDAVNDGLATIEAAIEQVRSMSLRLRPPLLDELGLPAALRWLTDQYAGYNDIEIAVEAPDGIGLSDSIAQTCYRIAQEALTNMARHSGATKAWVRLAQNSNELSIMVADNGRGFSGHERHDSGGTGLLGMEERVKLVGGTLQITSSPEEGTQIIATFESGNA